MLRALILAALLAAAPAAASDGRPLAVERDGDRLAFPTLGWRLQLHPEYAAAPPRIARVGRHRRLAVLPLEDADPLSDDDPARRESRGAVLLFPPLQAPQAPEAMRARLGALARELVAEAVAHALADAADGGAPCHGVEAAGRQIDSRGDGTLDVLQEFRVLVEAGGSADGEGNPCAGRGPLDWQQALIDGRVEVLFGNVLARAYLGADGRWRRAAIYLVEHHRSGSRGRVYANMKRVADRLTPLP